MSVRYIWTIKVPASIKHVSLWEHNSYVIHSDDIASIPMTVTVTKYGSVSPVNVAFYPLGTPTNIECARCHSIARRGQILCFGSGATPPHSVSYVGATLPPMVGGDDCHLTITLYDHVGYVIGRNASSSSYKCGVFYKLVARDRKYFEIEDLLSLIPSGSPHGTFYMEMTSSRTSLDAQLAMVNITGQEQSGAMPSFDESLSKCTAPPVTFELKHAPAEATAAEARNTDEQGITRIQCTSNEVQSLMRKSEYFLKSIQKAPRGDGEEIKVSISDVDGKLFRCFVDFIHYGKYVYFMTERGSLPLWECCREMLQVSDMFLCHELSRTCARCILQVTDAETVFDDIHLLMRHYNGHDKMEIISRMGDRLKELKPQEKLVENVSILCHRLPDVATCFLSKLLQQT